MKPRSVVVMGVQGTGKTTIGKLLGERTGIEFFDGDNLHPPANREKMARGEPLDDLDRFPWLVDIGAALAVREADGLSTIIVCSALKRWYRELLRSYVPNLEYVHLHGPEPLIAQRLAGRDHEFMPNSLLDSQLGTLEPLAPHEAGIVVAIDQAPEQICSAVIRALDLPTRP